MTRENNIRVFEETYAECSINYVLRSAVRNSLYNQILFSEGESYTPRKTDSYERRADVIVSEKRTFVAARAYRGVEKAVLNFASSVTPGGGVKKGSFAQEESLSRISTLYPCLCDRKLWDGYYALNRMRHDRRNTDAVIYTPGVLVFRSDDERMKILDEDEWYSVNVLTCAAPDLREPHHPGADRRITESEIYSLQYKRIKRILEIASGEGNEVVVLGAFGCGAFRNPPHVVAEAMRKAVEEYIHRFRTIEIAVYTAPGCEKCNYEAFRDAFKPLLS